MNASEPLCLVINGPSAAGKSTLTTAIQSRSELPLLRFGLDELFQMVPDHWGGGLPGARHSNRGFSYREVPGIDGARRIHCGSDGHTMLRAMNAAVIAMLREGQGVVVDGQAFEPVINQELESGLRKLEEERSACVFVVELQVDDIELADRQRRHRHPAGLSLFHNRLPPQSMHPDLRLDTTHMDSDHVAETVWNQLVVRYPSISE